MDEDGSDASVPRMPGDPDGPAESAGGIPGDAFFPGKFRDKIIGMSGKRLELTEEILDRVVYGMENQKERLFLDPTDGILKPGDEGSVPPDSIPMPPWGPTEGFRLMDAFIETLPDAAFRAGLQDILHSGSGVFRRFKDAVKERPGTESLWHRYKKREMRKAALSWLSRWSEALALEALGPEPEEWDDLAATDFSFRSGRPEDLDEVKVLDAAAEAEAFPSLSKGERERYSLRREAEAPEPSGLIVAENPSGEIAGFAWFSVSCYPSDSRGRVIQVYTRPEYRGLGIGRRLTESALDALLEKGAKTMSIRTCGNERLNKTLESRGFGPAAVLWRKDSE